MSMLFRRIVLALVLVCSTIVAHAAVTFNPSSSTWTFVKGTNLGTNNYGFSTSCTPALYNPAYGSLTHAAMAATVTTVSGTLPPGLSYVNTYNSGGTCDYWLWSGTPSTVGTYTFTLQASILNDYYYQATYSCGFFSTCREWRYASGTGESGTQTYTITIVEPLSAPTNVVAVAGNGEATVSFSQPTSNGGSAISQYTVTSTPGSNTATGTASPITVSGLTGGTAYYFTVRATNAASVSATSTASNTITLKTPQSIAFSIAPSISVGNSGVVSATATSGLAVSLSTTTPSICSISGGTVTGLSAGTCIVAADQAGNSTFSAATQATQNIGIRQNQTIAFPVPTGLTIGSTAVLSASATSGLVVTFASQSGGVCTVSGATVTAVAAGSCVIAADQPGNSTFNAAPQVAQTFTVRAPGLAQSISFTQPTRLTIGSASALNATASSGLAVTFSSISPSVCAVTGSTVTALAAGTCTVAADQVGNTTYAAAPQVSQSFTVPSNQTINFNALAEMTIGASGVMSASATSGLTVAFSSLSSSICTVSGTTVTAVAAGTCIVAADQTGSNLFNTATQVTRSFTVQRQGQTIALTLPTGLSIGSPTVLSASASSGLTVALSSLTPSVCTVAGSTVTSIKAGTCTIAANQVGNNTFNAASQVTQSVAVRLNQTITFVAPSSVAVGSYTSLSASSSSTWSPTFSSQTASVCNMSGTTVVAIAVGTCIIAADQVGNTTYNPAPQVVQTITVRAATQVHFQDEFSSVSKTSTSITLKVLRGDGFASPASISYATADGTAIAGKDYKSTSGTLTWATGDATTKSIVIPLVTNSEIATRRSFKVELKATNGAITGATSAKVVITDGPRVFSGNGNQRYTIGADGKVWGLGDGGSGNVYLLGGDALTQGIRTTPRQTAMEVYRIDAGQTPSYVPSTQLTFSSIAVGDYFTIAMDDEGAVYGWGDTNSLVSTGDHDPYRYDATKGTPVQLTLPAGVRASAVAAGMKFSVVLGQDGKLYQGGFTPGESYTLFSNSYTPLTTSSEVFKGVACGSYHCLALRSDGTAWAWGSMAYGQLGNGSITSKSYFKTPVQVRFPSTVVQVDAIGTASYALLQDGTVMAWGMGKAGRNTTATPQLLSLPQGLKVKRIAGDVALAEDGRIIRLNFWENGTGILAPDLLPNPNPPAAGVRDISNGLAIGEDGSAWGWGDNTYGLVGDGTLTRRNAPTQVLNTAATGYLSLGSRPVDNALDPFKILQLVNKSSSAPSTLGSTLTDLRATGFPGDVYFVGIVPRSSPLVRLTKKDHRDAGTGMVTISFGRNGYKQSGPTTTSDSNVSGTIKSGDQYTVFASEPTDPLKNSNAVVCMGLTIPVLSAKGQAFMRAIATGDLVTGLVQCPTVQTPETIAKFVAQVSGPITSRTISANINPSADDRGQTLNVYSWAIAPDGSQFMQTPTGWSVMTEAMEAAMTLTVPDAGPVVMPVIKDADLSAVSGTLVYVGMGLTWQLVRDLNMAGHYYTIQ